MYNNVHGVQVILYKERIFGPWLLYSLFWSVIYFIMTCMLLMTYYCKILIWMVKIWIYAGWIFSTSREFYFFSSVYMFLFLQEIPKFFPTLTVLSHIYALQVK